MSKPASPYCTWSRHNRHIGPSQRLLGCCGSVHQGWILPQRGADPHTPVAWGPCVAHPHTMLILDLTARKAHRGSWQPKDRRGNKRLCRMAKKWWTVVSWSCSVHPCYMTHLYGEFSSMTEGHAVAHLAYWTEGEGKGDARSWPASCEHIVTTADMENVATLQLCKGEGMASPNWQSRGKIIGQFVEHN